MGWWILAAFALGLTAGGILSFVRPCASGRCDLEPADDQNDCQSDCEALPNTPWQAADACRSVLSGIDESKRQLQNRLAMLDEMIDKADREIDGMQQTLATAARRRVDMADDSLELGEMLRLLRACGYAPDQLSQLTGRSEEEIARLLGDDDWQIGAA